MPSISATGRESTLSLAGSLYVSSAELDRARQRVSEPAWAQAVDHLRTAAERAVADAAPFPGMDASWYDEAPHRDFGETYRPFHAMSAPAMRRMNQAQTLARAGAVLGNPRYIERARQDLVDLSRQAAFHVRHHDAGLVFAELCIPAADLLRALDDRLSEDERANVGAVLNRAAEGLLDAIDHWTHTLARMPYNNHLAYHHQGLMAIGLVLDRPDWIALALDGPRGFRALLAGATYDDGLCYESSTVYHFATLSGLVGMAELSRLHPELGRDLYRETVANGRTLKDMFDAPLGLLLPGGELPAVGDCYAERAPLWRRLAARYELGFAVYADPRYAWLLRREPRTSFDALRLGADALPEGRPPGGRTRLWIQHGYGLLTTTEGSAYWAESNTAPVAFLGFDRNGIHHHRDRLGLQVAGAGRLWLEDVESRSVAGDGHGFSAPIQEGFNRTSLAHNVVMIDEQSQQASADPLETLAFLDLPAVKTLTVADARGALYQGVAQARSVAVTPSYVLDVVQVESAGAERSFDLLLHPRADGPATCGALSFQEPAKLPSEPPYAILRDAIAAVPDASGKISLRWTQSDAACSAVVQCLDGCPERVIRANWPRQSDRATGEREMFMVRIRGRRACFLTLYCILPAAAQGEAPWHIDGAKRVFNGQHGEIHVRVTDGSESIDHVFMEIVPVAGTETPRV